MADVVVHQKLNIINRHSSMKVLIFNQLMIDET